MLRCKSVLLSPHKLFGQSGSTWSLRCLGSLHSQGAWQLSLLRGLLGRHRVLGSSGLMNHSLWAQKVGLGVISLTGGHYGSPQLASHSNESLRRIARKVEYSSGDYNVL